ncbi:hypothetical protein ACNEV4_003649, partial [Escherichia coli]
KLKLNQLPQKTQRQIMCLLFAPSHMRGHLNINNIHKNELIKRNHSPFSRFHCWIISSVTSLS